MPPPFFAATCTIQIRLRLEAAAIPAHPIMGGRGAALESSYGDVVELRGWDRPRKHMTLDPRMAGDASKTAGHIGVTYDVLEAAGILEEQLMHARIVGIERRGRIVPQDFRVVEVHPTGHLEGGPIYVRLGYEIDKDLRGAA